MSGTSNRVDETYIKVGKTCKYLYRAVDKEGPTIEFMLSAKRDVSVAKRFFRKMMSAEHRHLPFSIRGCLKSPHQPVSTAVRDSLLSISRTSAA